MARDLRAVMAVLEAGGRPKRPAPVADRAAAEREWLAALGLGDRDVVRLNPGPRKRVAPGAKRGKRRAAPWSERVKADPNAKRRGLAGRSKVWEPDGDVDDYEQIGAVKNPPAADGVAGAGVRTVVPGSVRTFVRGVLSKHLWVDPEDRQQGGKSVCATSVVHYFGAHPDEYDVCYRFGDVKRLLGHEGWRVLSRDKKFGVGARAGAGDPLTVRQLKFKVALSYLGKLKKGAEGDRWPREVAYYLVYVPGHVMLLNARGYPVVDTAPRTGDNRVVRSVYAVMPK